MKTSITSRIRTCRAILWDLFLSAVGCFVLRGCFRLVADGRDGTETRANPCAVGQARDPLAYVGAALILLALAANEQPGRMSAAAESHFWNDAETL